MLDERGTDSVGDLVEGAEVTAEEIFHHRPGDPAYLTISFDGEQKELPFGWTGFKHRDSWVTGDDWIPKGVYHPGLSCAQLLSFFSSGDVVEVNAVVYDSELDQKDESQKKALFVESIDSALTYLVQIVE